MTRWTVRGTITKPDGRSVMKANKALKRLTKIEELIADVTERYSTSALHIRAALVGAKLAVARLKA